MQKLIRTSLTILALALLPFAASGCAGRSAVAVKTAVASNQELSTTLDLSGVLVPAQEADMSSQIAGKVTSLGFQNGDAVKAGDVLMQLDTDTLNAQLAQAEAGLQSAQAAVGVAEDKAAEDKITLDSAQKSYNRTESLFNSAAASQSDLDNATATLDTAQTMYKNDSGPALAVAQAAVATASANVDNLQVQLSEATITSPLDGFLANRNVNVGEVVSPGVTVMSVVDDSSLKLRGEVSQNVLPLLTLGQTMEVAVDSYPGSEYKGSVTTIGPIAVSTGQVFPFEVTIKNDGRLIAGLTAHASATVTASGIVVPAPAVVQNNGASFVFVIKNGIASKRAVSTGQSGAQGVLILRGLAAGEQVAITNTDALTDNTPVQAD